MWVERRETITKKKKKKERNRSKERERERVESLVRHKRVVQNGTDLRKEEKEK